MWSLKSSSRGDLNNTTTCWAGITGFYMIYDTFRPLFSIHSSPPDSDFPPNYPTIAKWYGFANTINFNSLTRNTDRSAVLVQCEDRTFQQLDLWVILSIWNTSSRPSTHSHSPYAKALRYQVFNTNCRCSDFWWLVGVSDLLDMQSKLLTAKHSVFADTTLSWNTKVSAYYVSTNHNDLSQGHSNLFLNK